MKICSIINCNQKAVGFGFCDKHYRRFKKHGNPLYQKRSRDHPEICKISECNELFQAEGYCQKHYVRFKKFGNPLFRKIEDHGLSKTPEYRVWHGMKQRCYNQNLKAYKNYGGRGITVCDKWKNSFSAFYEDMGPRPFKDAEIDRKNNDGNYEPDNCRWVTHKINSQNRRHRK